MEMQRYSRILLIVIVLGGTLLRIWGFNHKINTDENKVVTPSALLINGEQKPLLFPHSLYPHLYHYALALTFIPLALTDDEAIYKTQYYTSYLLVARMVTALVGSATILLVYLMGRLLIGTTGGLFAALFFATIPLHVKYSHYTHVDLPLTFMTALTMIIGIYLWKKKTWTWYVLTGIAVGLSAATHYPGFTLGIVLLIAHGAYVFEAPSKIKALVSPRFLVALVLIPLSFALVSPYFVLDWRQQLKTYQLLNNRALAGDLGYTRTSMLWPLTTKSPDWGIPFTATGFIWEVNPIFFVLAISGVLLAALRKRWDLVMVCGATALVLYLSITGYVRMTAVKRLLPLTPILAVLAAYALVTVVQDWKASFRRIAIAVITLLIVIPSTWHLIGFNIAYSAGSTHEDAVSWAEQNLPRGSVILQHTPLMLIRWDDERFKTVRLNEVYANLNPADPEVSHDRAQSLDTRISHDGIQFVVLDSRIVDRYYDETSRSLYPETTASYRSFFDDVRKRGTLLYKATPQLWFKAGPRIEIYDVRQIKPQEQTL